MKVPTSIPIHRSNITFCRQLSGAMIRISNCEDRDAPANLDRTITISGNAESVALAQYLINMRYVCAPYTVLPVSNTTYNPPQISLQSQSFENFEKIKTCKCLQNREYP